MKRRPSQPLRTALGRAIRRRREAMGVSQAEIAARCRCTKASLQHIESGIRAPSMGMLSDLSWALDVRLAVLFGEVEEMLEVST